MNDLLAGFLLGVAGSAHCLGMCGPLALWGSGGGKPAPTSVSAAAATFVVFHLSRIATYVVLGTAAGVAGGLIADAGWRRVLAIAAGTLLIAQAVGLAGRFAGVRYGRRLAAFTSRAARAMPRHPLARSVALGALNGLLPCGLLYGALAAAAGLGRLSAAVAFMMAFGIGSLPAFGALAYSAHTVIPRLPQRLRQAAPVTLALVGLMLIARGLPAPQAHEHQHSGMRQSGGAIQSPQR